MIRNALAALAGPVTAFALIAAAETLGRMLFPVSADPQLAGADAMEAWVATLSLPALLFPMFAWIIGAFAGTLAACAIGTLRPLLFGALTGLFVLAWTISELLWVQYPLWFSVFAVIGIVTSTWLAVGLAGHFSPGGSD